MKPAFQTIVGEKGNCFSACVASLLEVECEDIPNIHDYPKGHWFSSLNAVLREKYNCCLLGVEDPKGRVFLPNRIPFIATVKNGASKHAVIMEYRPQPEVVHDPRGPNNGISGVITFIAVLVRL